MAEFKWSCQAMGWQPPAKAGSTGGAETGSCHRGAPCLPSTACLCTCWTREINKLSFYSKLLNFSKINFYSTKISVSQFYCYWFFFIMQLNLILTDIHTSVHPPTVTLSNFVVMPILQTVKWGPWLTQGHTECKALASELSPELFCLHHGCILVWLIDMYKQIKYRVWQK